MCWNNLLWWGNRTVLWFRCLVAGLSPRRPGFNPSSVSVGFVVNEVALGSVFLPTLWFPLSVIPQVFHAHIFLCHRRYVISAHDSVGKQRTAKWWWKGQCLTQDFFSGGGGFNKFSWGQRTERGSGGGSPLVRGSGGSCNLVHEISVHIINVSEFLVL
jgi:hypothetical protein